MTSLREAAQAALEFLDAEFGWSPGEAPRIDNLRAAMAEPVQEQPICDECGRKKADGWALYCVDCVEPVFAPPQRKPLTEDEIQELSQQHKFDSRMEKFVRIIERAHGIK